MWGGMTAVNKSRNCDCDGCRTPARFQVGFIAPLRRIAIMPSSLNKDFQMWLSLGVCGSHREDIKTIDQVLTEEQMTRTNADMIKQGKPVVDFRAGFVMFIEIKNGKPDHKSVTRADGKPFDRVYKQAPAIIRN